MLKFDFIEGLIGANYKWWTHGSWEDGSPFFTKSYSIEDIFQKGINCAGLVNVFLHENQKQIPIIANYPGGTFAYYKVYKNIFQKIEKDTKLYKGDILLKKYKNKHEQGHIAIVISEEKYLIIEACTEGGVQYSDNMNFDWFCRLSDIPNKKTNQ